MRGISARKKRQALYGWLKWLPVVLLPFLVLLADTCLNIRTWHNDYIYGQLARQMKSLEAQLAEVAADQAGLEALDRLAQKADELAMVEPAPEQFQSIHGALPPMVEPEDLPQEAEVTLASLEEGLEQAGALAGQLLESDLPALLQEHVGPSVEAMMEVAKPLPGWVAEEITPALEEVAAMSVPVTNALVEKAGDLRDTVNYLGHAALDTPAQAPVQLAGDADTQAESPSLLQEPLEPAGRRMVQQIIPQPLTFASQAAPAAAPGTIDKDPDALLESL